MLKWIYNPEAEDPSLTRALLIIGFIVANIKLLMSGITVNKIQVGVFSGTDYAAVVGSVGALYAARRHSSKEELKK